MTMHEDRKECMESHGTYVTPLSGGMPLHHVVGINCKKGATTENQGSGVKYMG